MGRTKCGYTRGLIVGTSALYPQLVLSRPEIPFLLSGDVLFFILPLTVLTGAHYTLNLYPKRRYRLSRPQTARGVAQRTKTLHEFGLNLRDWLHELRRVSSRAQLFHAVKTRPPPLRNRFEQGDLADAFLAAQVEWLCRRSQVTPPRWTHDTCYVLDEPWFSIPSKRLRAHLLLDTPDEFRNRNLFTTPEGEVNIRNGRPFVDAAVKREKARLRQQQYRLRQAKCSHI